MTEKMTFANTPKQDILLKYAPASLNGIGKKQSDIPLLAKNEKLVAELEQALPQLPTHHGFYLRDATKINFLKPNSVHLAITSPPYWTLKKYNERHGQLGVIQDYESFIRELNKVWKLCFDALVPGGRLVCVVGDVCLSRRKNNGRHTVVPLHASIQEECRKIGYDNLAPIIWYKIANACYESPRNSSFLGKPYEPNAIIKNDIEFILMQRKPGGYRSPSILERIFSVIPEGSHKKWFNQIWEGLTGASTRNHPAPYPIELAERLIRMFSFVGDTVLDPFLGSGTTSIAAWRTGRNSIGIEIDEDYLDYALNRFAHESQRITSTHQVETFR